MGFVSFEEDLTWHIPSYLTPFGERRLSEAATIGNHKKKQLIETLMGNLFVKSFLPREAKKKRDL